MVERVCGSGCDLIGVSLEVGVISQESLGVGGQDCLMGLVGLVKSLFRSGQEWLLKVGGINPEFSLRVGRIGPESCS